MTGKLPLAEGWRRTDLVWRPSLLDLLGVLPLSGDELKAEEKTALGIDPNKLAVRQVKFVHSTLKAAGLMRDDVIVGYDGTTFEGTMKEFLKRIRGSFIAGYKISLDVIREGKKVEVSYTFK